MYFWGGDFSIEGGGVNWGGEWIQQKRSRDGERGDRRVNSRTRGAYQQKGGMRHEVGRRLAGWDQSVVNSQGRGSNRGGHAE